jgi:hypothetical protein
LANGSSRLRTGLRRALSATVLLLAPSLLAGQQSGGASPLTLAAGTPVKLRLAQTLSSAHTQKGDRLEFVVREDVALNGRTVIRAGAPAWGTVSEVHPRRMLGIPGKLVLHPDSVELADGERAPLDAQIEFRGHRHLIRMAAGMVVTSLVCLPASPVFLLTRGSDGFALKSSDVTAYLNHDQALPTDKLPASERVAELDAMIDFLPPRVLNGHGREGDMVNLIFVASEGELTQAFARAGWTHVDQSKARVAWHLFCHGTHYTRLPMAHFFLFGRTQDYSYALPDPLAIVARRHHVRIWKTDAHVNGDPVWVAAATHDISIDLRLRRLHITHRIDPEVDAERDFIAANLADSRAVARTQYLSAATPIYQATTTEGQPYYSDSRLLLVQLRSLANDPPRNADLAAAAPVGSMQPVAAPLPSAQTGEQTRPAAFRNEP